MEFSNEELENFAKGTEVFMAILDQEGAFLKINDRWASKFGREKETLLQASIYDLVHEAEVGELKASIQKTIDDGQVSHKIITMINQGYQTFSFQFDLTYSSDRIYLVGFDVTEFSKEHVSLVEMSKLTKTGGWHYDPIRDESFWSPEVYKIHELPLGTKINAEVALGFYLPIYKEQIDLLVKNLYERHESYDFSGMIKTESGKEKWIRTIARPVIQDGKIIYIHGVTADRTRLHNNVEKIRRESETRKMALKGIKSGLFDHDLISNTVAYSPDFKKMIGLSDQKVLPEEEFRKLIHPDDLDGATKRYIKQLKASVNHYFNHYRVKHTKEGYQHYEVYGWCKKDERGKVVRMVGNLINVNDRVLLANEKDRIKKCLEAMVDNGFIYSMLLDMEGVILMADQQTLQIIRHDYDVDPIKKRIKYVDVMPDIFKPTFLSEFNKAITGQRVRKEVERPLLDGSMQWLDVMYQPITNSEGEVIQVLTNLMDITQRKKAEISLIESRNHAQALSRLKSGILSNMSHEMRTPLNGIMGISELLLEKDLDADSHEMIKMQKTSEKRLLNVLNDLITLSDLDAMRLRMKLRQHSINQLAQTCFEMYHHQAKMKRLRFEVEKSDVEGIILIDHEMMVAALSAVVNNALKYTSEGSVKILCHVDEQDWGQIRVIDTGIGIAREDFDRIFENFEIANIGMNMKYEGSGIGLSISRKIIQLMGGSIEVISELGKGSEFSIRLPAITDTDSTDENSYS